MKWIDLPPVWLIACLVLAWAAPFRFTPGVLAIFGWIALAVGVMLMVFAVVEFARARTTIIPRKSPSALVTSGIFRWSRNPIYLADVLFLAGASLIWGSVVGLLIVPVFAAVIERRFILGEESKLSATYGEAFDEYALKVRRWL